MKFKPDEAMRLAPSPALDGRVAAGQERAGRPVLLPQLWRLAHPDFTQIKPAQVHKTDRSCKGPQKSEEVRKALYLGYP